MARWEGKWRETNPDGSVGALLGSEILDGNFGERYWGFGEVFADRSDNLTFDATMDIIVQKSGLVRFTMNGDDGFILRIDNRLVIDEWQGGRL